jgi:acyl-coenzyme A thioesterase PaaI-like protein
MIMTPIIKQPFISSKILPEHGYCFVCGQENPHGIGIVWHADILQAMSDDGHFAPGDVQVWAEFQFSKYQQGPPGHAHGGASAAVIDEAMGATVWQSGHRALLAHIALDYKLPVLLAQPVRAEAWVEKVDGRKIYARGHILLADGQVAVAGSGLYLHIPTFFESHQRLG